MSVVLPIPLSGLDVDALTKQYPVEIRHQDRDTILLAIPAGWYIRFEDRSQTWLALRDERNRVILSFQPAQKRTYVGGRGG